MFRLTRPQTVVIGVGLAMGALYVALPYSGISELVLYDGVVVLAIGASIVGLRKVWDTRRLPWLLTTIALGGWLVGELTWWQYTARGLDPFPSIADAAYLLAYIPLAMGAAALTRTRSGDRDRTAWLDAGVLTLVFGLVVWVALMEPYAADGSITFVQKAVTLAYPLADIVAAAFVLRLVLTRAARTRAAVLFLVGVTLTLAADLVFAWLDLRGLYNAGSVIDLVWAAGYLFIGVAALDPSAAQAPDEIGASDLGRSRLMAVLGAVLVPQAILFYATTHQWGERVEVVAIAVSTLVMVLVSARLWGLLGVARRLESRRGSERLSALVLSLGRRNQNLIGRQLAAIEDMERSEEDPERLERLFELDNLSTRMRRNAESMLVLAGEASPQAWAGAVPISQMARMATSEVEGYRRVGRATIEPCAVRGDAVADLAHLLAELLENALAYSPPTSRVWLSARRHGKGCVLSVVDQGLGLEGEALAAANRLLARSGEESDEDVPTSELGLFVVGRLASRYGCRVQLQPNPNGGLTAWVLLPPSMIVEPSPAEVSPPTSAAPSVAAPQPPAPPARPAPEPAPRPMATVADGVVGTPPAAAPVSSGEARADAGTTQHGLRRRAPARHPVPAAAVAEPGAPADRRDLGGQLHRYQVSVARARTLESGVSTEAEEIRTP